jgi:hypothetical protein
VACAQFCGRAYGMQVERLGSTWRRTPRSASASTTAFITETSAPAQPASPPIRVWLRN